MSKLTKLFALILVLLFAGNAYSQDALTSGGSGEVFVEPFGGIGWDDGLYDAVMKVAAFENLEKLDLRIGNSASSAVSFKGVKNKDDFRARLTQMIVQKFLCEDNALKKCRGGESSFAVEYVTIEGKTEKYVGQELAKIIYLHASPVVIKAVPYEMNIMFQSHPGWAIMHPDKTEKEINGRFAFPYVLAKVELLTKSAAFDAKKGEIDGILLQKYGSSFHDNISGGACTEKSLKNESCWFRDSKKRETDLTSGGTIIYSRYATYSHYDIYSEFSSIYEENLAKIDRAANTGKKDQSGGL